MRTAWALRGSAAGARSPGAAVSASRRRPRVDLRDVVGRREALTRNPPVKRRADARPLDDAALATDVLLPVDRAVIARSQFTHYLTVQLCCPSHGAFVRSHASSLRAVRRLSPAWHLLRCRCRCRRRCFQLSLIHISEPTRRS